MSKDIPLPYAIIHLEESGETIQIIGNNAQITEAALTNASNLTIEQNMQSRINQQVCLQEIQTLQGNMEFEDDSNVVYEIVYPQQLNLKPVYKQVNDLNSSCFKPPEVKTKRGRPKKKTNEELPPPESEKPPVKAPRTRSGRLVKLPKYIESNFKRIEISDAPEVNLTEFVRVIEEPKAKDEKVGELLEFHQRKRTIASHYRCPKCQKAYLGKNKMIQHLKKYPDHGPLPDGYSDLNFDVWNYLVDITQKAPPGQRGAKFCDEITNLLHNVQLLNSALFKTVDEQKNSVNIDKVLGNAIGLTPGKYNFEESELYKDVTVLQLITNSDFFNPSKSNKNNTDKTKKEENVKDEGMEIVENSAVQSKVTSSYFPPKEIQPVEAGISTNSLEESSKTTQKLDNKTNSCAAFSGRTPELSYDKTIAVSAPTVELKKSIHQNLENLLSENSLLQSLPTLRNTVDELMLTNVDTATNLLDNSTSSDEVMNVDQFVNERFKKITEPDIELTAPSLNLELPLDLFQFHSSSD